MATREDNNQAITDFGPQLLEQDSSPRGLEKVAILTLTDAEIYSEKGRQQYNAGEFVQVQDPEEIDGLAAVMPEEFFEDSPEYISEDERNSGGFLLTNGNRAFIPEAQYSNVELKSRFSDELRNYPEAIHVHNVPEWYFAVGEFEMVLGNESMPEEPYLVHREAENAEPSDSNALLSEKPEWFDTYNLQDEAFGVKPGNYHGIVSKSDEAYLGVARGDPSGEEEWVGKWDLEGNQFYDHFPEQKPELTNITHYTSENT